MAGLNPNMLMAASGIGQIGSGIAGAVTQANAMRTQAAYQQQVGDTNARLSEMSASDAISRGDKSATLVQKQGQQTIGSQRAGLAAQGIDVNSGSASDVQSSTAAMAAQDALTVKNNAWREAWGYKVQANQATLGGQFAKIGGDAAANSTLLTGGMNAIGTAFKTGYSIYNNWGSGTKTAGKVNPSDAEFANAGLSRSDWR